MLQEVFLHKLWYDCLLRSTEDHILGSAMEVDAWVNNLLTYFFFISGNRSTQLPCNIIYRSTIVAIGLTKQAPFRQFL